MLLNCHSYFSLRFGTINPEELLALAAKNNHKNLVLTDINNTSACLDFVRLSKKYNIKPILGVDFRNGAKQQFIAIAKNNIGFAQINRYLSQFLHDKTLKIPEFIDEELQDCFIIYPFDFEVNYQLKSNEFLGIKPDQLSRLQFSKREIDLEKLVVLKTTTFRNKKDFNTHRLLRAIDNNVLLSKLPKSEQSDADTIFQTPLDIEKRYETFPEILKNTETLLQQCNIDFDFSDNQKPANKHYFLQTAEDDYKLLKTLAYNGVAYRYGTLNNNINSRIEKELHIIKAKDFVSYFLINWDILKYARSKNYFYVGRGSGANSILAYLLRITDVDPIELDLYFERFINMYRTNPPDFDLDFSWRDRDDITRYIFNKYENTALITVYNTFKFKAAVRELGKVFGLPKSELDKLSRGKYDVNQLDQLSKLVLIYSQYIQGFPNYLGIHAGGILIAEKPIHHYTATFLPPKGYATTHFDMVIAEDIGLYKFDILSQRGLGKIKEAVEIIDANYTNQSPLDIHDIKRFKQDNRIKNLLRNAQAIGCFYVESPAMRMLLKKLQVDDYLGLVAASSVIRPGVSNSGMMQQYIIRHRNPERRKDAHPTLLERHLRRYGLSRRCY